VAFIVGWLWGVVFFYGSCYWLTYSLIRYGHLPSWLAYSSLIIPVALVSFFPAFACLILSKVLKRWGAVAILAAPFVWISFEWARLGITGQLWNAIGYSQAYVPTLIQSARWGGVYAVGFMIVLANAALAFLFLERSMRALASSTTILISLGMLVLVTGTSWRTDSASVTSVASNLIVVAIQPNVPMEPISDPAISKSLIDRHQALSAEALQSWDRSGQLDNERVSVVMNRTESEALAAGRQISRLVIWPESPMNFTYGNDRELREVLANFAQSHHTSVLFNSLEAAPQGGDYNSALLINEEGRLVAQYDKIRLMPFGEYVPLPPWMPGSSAIAPMVGGFTAGTKYPLMPVGKTRAGVFICFESAFPDIARAFANEGAGVLINISNDGYLGPTPVMRQHLANAIFRAVENNRPVLRVTNTGLTAYIDSRGAIKDVGPGFQSAARVWSVREVEGRTFYTRHGEVFVAFCALVTLIALAATRFRRAAKN